MQTVFGGYNLKTGFQLLGIFDARVGHAASSESCESSLLFANVFVPHGGIRGYVSRQRLNAFLRMEIDHCDSIFPQPVNAAMKIHGFADHEGADMELPHQAAAVPAGRKRSDHDFVAITALPSRFAKRIGLAVHRRIILLHPSIASPPQ